MKICRPAHARDTRWIVGVIAATAMVLLAGCSSLSVIEFGGSGEEERRAEELQSLLDRYTREFAGTIERAAEDVVDSTSDLETRRTSTRFKLLTIPRVKELSRSQASQGEIVLSLWLYTEAMSRFVEQEEAQELFKVGQPIFLAASEQLVGKIEEVARQMLDSEEDFLTARELIHDYAQRSTPRWGDSGVTAFGTVEAGIMELTRDAGALEWLPSFSLEAFNPFSGLNESAAAIRHFTDKTNAQIDDVYTQLPWRIELLLYDIEGRDTVRETKANLKRFSDSAVSLAGTAERLPADMQGLVSTTLDEIDVKQEGLRLTLQQAEDALIRAEGVVSGLSQTATSLTEAGKAWDATFQTLGLGGGQEASEGEGSEAAAAGGSEEAGRPFDILDYRDTAEELRSVAVELRGLVQDVHALTGAGDDGEPLRNIELAAEAAAAVAISQGRELVDHAALRLFQLLGAVLLAALLYRVVAWRFAPRPPLPES